MRTLLRAPAAVIHHFIHIRSARIRRISAAFRRICRIRAAQRAFCSRLSTLPTELLHQCVLVREARAVDDEADHVLAGAEALAAEHMTYEAFATLLVVWVNAVVLHPADDGVQYRLIFFDAEEAVVTGDDVVRPAGVEAGDDLSGLVAADRVLRLVPVAERALHADDRLEDLVEKFLRHLADTKQVVIDLRLLEVKLGRIAHLLELTAAALTRDRAGRGLPRRARLYELHEAGKAVVLLHLRRGCDDLIPDDRVLDKPDELPLGLSDAKSFARIICNRYLKLLIFFHNFILSSSRVESSVPQARGYRRHQRLRGTSPTTACVRRCSSAH